MINQIVALYDEVARCYMVPNFEISDIAAVRSFSASVKTAQAKQEGLLFTNPGDYSLWRIGTFDTENGELVPCHPELLIRGNEV